MKIGICGVGHIGLSLSLVLAKFGNEVVAIDINPQRILDINNQIHFHEPSVNDYLRKYKHNLTFTTDDRKLEGCEVVIIMVNTPSLPNGSFDTSTVEKLVREIRQINEESLITISSNINIGACDKLHKNFEHIAYCPEFIAQGSIIHDFENPKFTVIGAYNKFDAAKLWILWKKVHNKHIYTVKPIEAEIIKLGLNVSYCMGITWANIIGELSDTYNADSKKILNIMYKDWRNYKKGLGFGGPCFPRDTKCLSSICKKIGVYTASYFIEDLNFLNFLTETSYYNKLLQKCHGSTFGFLGVSYKPNVSYVWGSQALNIALRLEACGYTIYVYEPLAETEAKKLLKHTIFCETVEECIKKSDVIFIGTSGYKDVVTDKPVVNPWK